MNENTVPDEGEELIMTDEEIAISDSALDAMWKKIDAERAAQEKSEANQKSGAEN